MLCHWHLNAKQLSITKVLIKNSDKTKCTMSILLVYPPRFYYSDVFLCYRGPAPFVLDSPAYYELFKETPQPEEEKQKYTEKIKEIVASHVLRTTEKRYNHCLVSSKLFKPGVNPYSFSQTLSLVY